MAALSGQRIIGEDVFFNFIEVSYDESEGQVDYVRKIKNHELDGVIVKNVFSTSEIEAIKAEYFNIDSNYLINTPNGSIFPAPFSSVRGEDSTLDFYVKKLDELKKLGQKNNIGRLLEKLQSFFDRVALSYNVKVPVNNQQNEPISPGTFRNFKPNCGGLFVHCGYFFQEQFQGFFTVLESDIVLDGQLSYFLVLQNPEIGGELTIYDMLWKDVKRKEKFDDPSWVIDEKGDKINVENVKSFQVNPQAGDILVFSGGPIWHRVEDIKGEISRITFGGFINFSTNDDKLFYWS